MAKPIAVYLEVTRKRTFAARYAKVMARSRLDFKVPTSLDDLKVVERLKGNATTEFGAPGVPPAADERAVPAAELKRLKAILEACWRTLDRMADAHAGAQLAKGPRGGGRSLPKIVEHVAGAEEGYLSKLGSRTPREPAALHPSILAALAARARNKPVAEPNKVEKLWSPRFYVRRSAWHALDHAWEIEDRAEGS